jgi:hypothetical protein
VPQSLYSIAEYEMSRISYRYTVQNAQTCNISWVTPWLWLGGGGRRMVDASHDGSIHYDYFWDYDIAYSWMIGKEMNDDFYAQHPARFAPWDRARRVAFFPNPLNPSTWKVPQVINKSRGWPWAAEGGSVLSSVSLKHFVAYVKGAAQMRCNDTSRPANKC